MKNKTKKDWVTMVLDDLNKLELSFMSMEEIKSMKKTSFITLIKQRINRNTFKHLEDLKKSHSKVENIEHSDIKIQKYLQPNKEKITREESQLIFKLRCRVTTIKHNLKGKYDNLECHACGNEEKTQQHILQCEKLNRNEDTEVLNYEKLFNGTVMEKLKIAQQFKENFDKLENMKK